VSTDFIRETVGVVERYDRGKGFGWIKPVCDKWNDAFVSYRNIEPEIEGLKRLFNAQLVRFDLHTNDKGFEARNVRVITQEVFDDFNQGTEDNKFNK